MQLQREIDVLNYINRNDTEHQYEMCVCNNVASNLLWCKIKETYCNISPFYHFRWVPFPRRIYELDLTKKEWSWLNQQWWVLYH